MTYKNTKTILFASLVAASLLLVPLGTNNAYAEHDLEEDNPFTSGAGGGTQSICLDLNEMDNVDVNGSTGNWFTIFNAADNALDMYDDDTVMDLTRTYASNCSSSANKMGSDSHTASVQGVEWDINAGQNSHYVVMELNTSRDWSTSSTCKWFQDMNPEYIYNHEMGHFAGLDHTDLWWTSNSHSIMKPSCNSEFDDVKTDDITQINGFY